MKYDVHVQPRSKRDLVERTGEAALRVATTKPASDNQANLAVVKLVAKFLGVKRSQVVVVGGQKARDKVVVVTD